MDAINEITTNPFYKDMCLKFSKYNEELAKELYQEFCIIILEYNQDELQSVYEQKKLMYFSIGIIKRMTFSSTSPFYRKIRKFGIITSEIIPEVVGSDSSLVNDDFGPSAKEMLEMKLKIKGKILSFLEARAKTSKDTWYEYTLFQMYFESDLSYRKLAKKVNIPHNSIWKTIHKTLRIIRVEFAKDIDVIEQLEKFYI